MKGLFEIRSSFSAIRFNERITFPLLFWEKYWTEPGFYIESIYEKSLDKFEKGRLLQKKLKNQYKNEKIIINKNLLNEKVLQLISWIMENIH